MMRFNFSINLSLSLCLSCLVLVTACKHSANVTGNLPPISVIPVAEKSHVESDVFQFGDHLELFVKEDSTLNSSYPVREGGYIVIPRAGRLAVAGLSRQDAEKRVKEALQKTQLTEATVLVERISKNALSAAAPGASASAARLMVYVTGAVPKPGTHYVPLAEARPLGVYETILITGGFSRLAQDQRVEVMRADASGRRHRAVFDLRRVRQGSAEDPPVGQGDIIHVPEKVFGF